MPSFSGNNICVVANRHKTIFYHQVLEKAGVNRDRIFWICNGKRWLSFLLAQGYERTQICYYAIEDTDKVAELSFLRGIEATSEIPVWRMIQSDRRIRDRTNNPDVILNRVGMQIDQFLRKNNIRVCFGECTWSVELLSHAIAGTQGIPYLTPHTVRIPSERFAFFTDPFQKNMYRTQNASSDWSDYESVIESMVSSGDIPRPDYWYLNNSVPRVKANYLSKLLVHLKEELFDDARSEYMDLRLTERIRNRFLAISRSRQIKNLPFVRNIDFLADDYRLVLYALHKQPEASIDVMGGIHTDQAALIESISRCLPSDYRLLVKEHSNALGDRGKAFYKKLLELGNVVLVDPWANSRELMEYVDTVFTVSGTIAMEASILGVRAIAFCDSFFTDMPNVFHARDISDIPELLCRSVEENDESLVAFFRRVIEHSHTGLIGDPYCVPNSVDPGNIKRVASVFQVLINNICAEKETVCEV